MKALPCNMLFDIKNVFCFVIENLILFKVTLHKLRELEAVGIESCF